MAHARCMLDELRLHARSQLHASAYAPTPQHARTHTDRYVIITAFTQPQWFRQRTSMLRYTYIVCLVVLLISFTSLPVSLQRCSACQAVSLWEGFR
jgi:hypothetical protein